MGVSSFYSDPADVRRALEEAELVLGVREAGGSTGDEIGDGPTACCSASSPRTPRRSAASVTTRIAPLVGYDGQYSTDLVGTLSSYLGNDCNMNATASSIHAHRHTVAYRLERVQDLTGSIRCARG